VSGEVKIQSIVARMAEEVVSDPARLLEALVLIPILWEMILHHEKTFGDCFLLRQTVIDKGLYDIRLHQFLPRFRVETFCNFLLGNSEIQRQNCLQRNTNQRTLLVCPFQSRLEKLEKAIFQWRGSE